MTLELSKNAHYAIDIKTSWGFNYSVYVKGYEANSMIAFAKSLRGNNSVEPRYLTKQEYDDKIQPSFEDEKPKRKPRKKKDDSSTWHRIR